jgi:hypothetical protein
VCRARKAPERFHRSPEIHEAEVARARKNARARRARVRVAASMNRQQVNADYSKRLALADSQAPACTNLKT